ncbi:MAG: polyprenyl synthetase family protein [Candidatus Caldarchaeum sp.]|jgi:geranylgeranyl pyrophosphate synthase
MAASLQEPETMELVEILRHDIETRLRERIEGRPDRLLIERAVRGGKRLRPILLLTVFKALGGSDYNKALDVAVALELAHSASLVHDDIVDLDKTRRGRASLWYQIGAGKAIIQGHRIINLAFNIVLDIGEEMTRIFVEAWDRASKGILDEVVNKAALTERLYLLMIREKTASLFEAAAHAGAVLASASSDTIQIMRRYGSEVGTVYQLADDLTENINRKQLGRIYFLTHEMRERLIHLLVASKTKQVRMLFRAVTPYTPQEEFMKRQIVERIRSAVNLATDDRIPENPYKGLLRKLPWMFVKQMLRESSKRV